MTDFHDDDLLGEWLTQRCAELTESIAATMDLEAGFQDSLLRAQHKRLVTEIEASPADKNHPRDIETAPNEPARVDSPALERQLSSRIRRLPPIDRIALRPHVRQATNDAAEHALKAVGASLPPDRRVLEGCTGETRDAVVTEVLLDWQSYVCIVDSSLCQILGTQHRLLRELADRSLTLSMDATDWITDLRNTLYGTITGLREVFTMWGELVTGPAPNPVSRVRGYAAGARDLLMAFAVEINEIGCATNDFAEADLRDIDVNRVWLHGLRWSPATRWGDPTVRDNIRARSIALGNDLWEVRDHRDLAELEQQVPA
ncbi:hypothetical protein AB0L82_35365 [Nocardia sp. NPDC052001]|uniref:hypothetical protein n=1 Tax=Nocardia sp. NPDC052001 TaxID=3154853 RepID=UPI00342B9ABB